MTPCRGFARHGECTGVAVALYRLSASHDPSRSTFGLCAVCVHAAERRGLPVERVALTLARAA